MNITFEPNRPIYIQIIEEMKKQLVTGALPPGGRVAPVRELALEYGVNPNTMQKALSELEREGYFCSERTSGRSVTSDKTVLKRLRAEERYNLTSRYVSQMEELGVPRGELAALLSEFLSIGDAK